MIEQKLKTYFQQYRAITPRAEFLARSRESVVAAQQIVPVTSSFFMRVRETVTTGGALALASFLILAVVSGISYVSNQAGQIATASLNSNDSLAKEASQISFKVQIQDAEYFDESASQVVRALDRISGSPNNVQ